MADDRDPAALHARCCVLEAACERYEKEIHDLWNEVSALKICAACLPDIQASLKEMKTQIGNLQIVSKEQAVKLGILFLAFNAVLTAVVTIAFNLVFK